MGVEIVGFADNVVLTVIGEMLEEVEVFDTEDIGTVENWMNGIMLKIAHHKTEVLLVSNRKAGTFHSITAVAQTPRRYDRRSAKLQQPRLICM